MLARPGSESYGMLMRCKAENLRRLLAPRHIAFIGGRVLRDPIRSSEQIGYGGQIWVVNPDHEEIAGHRCFASVADLPEPPDAVFLALRRELSITVLRELAELGAGGCVAYAAGFAEVGPEGARLQEQLVEAAGEMALVGPNCYGLLNYIDGAALWASPAGGGHVDSGVALVSQSGNIAHNLTMTGRSVPLAYVISVGNQAALGPADFIPALVDDPRVTAIGLYIEGLDDVPAFSRAAEYALAKGKPLVAIKVGRSEIASRMALTHTSSLAGSDSLYDALFERLGIIRVPSLPALMETVKLVSLIGPRAGRRLGILTCSGGDAAIAADLAQDLGLTFPELSAAQLEALRAQLPHFVAIANPLDYNTSIWGDLDALERCFTTLAEGDIDAFMLVLDYLAPGLAGIEDWEACVEAMIRAHRTTGKMALVVSTFPELLPESSREKMLAAGVIPLQGLEDAMAGLAGAARYVEKRARDGARAAAGALQVQVTALAHDGTRTLSEAESKTRLAEFGVRVPESRLVPASAAQDAAAEIGFPVAVKAAGRALAHKTETGALALGLSDKAAVAGAVEKIAAAVTDTEGAAEQFLVEAMVQGAVGELIVGLMRDAQFGLALVVGSGGVLVNLVGDSHTLLLPTDRESVCEALGGLKASELLAGFRGHPPGDLEAAVDAVMAIAAYAESERDRLLELDVNPLIVLPEGQGVVAVDALIRLAEEESHE